MNFQRLWETLIVYNEEIQKVSLSVKNFDHVKLKIYITGDPEDLLSTPIRNSLSSSLSNKIVFNLIFDSNILDVIRKFFGTKLKVCLLN